MSSYTLYKHTSPSGKVYIGITCQKPETRWNNGKGYKHSPHFHAAIQAYGWENFQHEILAEGLTKEAAERAEIEYIARYDSTNRDKGYNADNGGSTGPKHTEQTRRRIGDANKRRICTESTRAKIREYRLSHPITPETGRKISEANRGRNHRPESVEKIRAAQPSKPVINLDTGQEYDSVNSAAKTCNLSPSHIVKVCKGLRNTTGGHHWAYKEVIA